MSEKVCVRLSANSQCVIPKATRDSFDPPLGEGDQIVLTVEGQLSR